MIKAIKQSFMSSGAQDVQYLNSLALRFPKILPAVYRQIYAKTAPLTIFLENLGASTDEEVIGSNVVQWTLQGGNTMIMTVEYVSNPSIAVGEVGDIVLSNGWLRQGAKILLGQNKTYRLLNNGVPVGGFQGSDRKYQFELIGTEGESTPPGVLQQGAIVQFIAGEYPEASERGHPTAHYSGGEMFKNPMATVRTDLQRTGDFLGHEIMVEISGKDQLGNPIQPLLASAPIFYNNGRDFIEEHLESVELNYIVSRTNMNPLTGQITGAKWENGRPVPSFSGIWEFFDLAKIFRFDLTSPIEYIAAVFESAREYLKDFMGEEQDVYIWTGSGGKRILRDIISYMNKRDNIQYQKDITSNNTVMAGIKYSTISDDLGTVNIATSPAFDRKDSPNKKLVYGGTARPAESYAMYMLFRTVDQFGKSNIRKFALGSKSHGKPVDRSLVIGHLPGMSGFAKTMPKSWQESLNQYNQNMVATGLDAETSLALTQSTIVFTNPTEMVVMKPYGLA